MIASRAHEWRRFFGAIDGDSAASEVTRMMHRVDDAFDLLNSVVKDMSGCPDSDVEEALRIARSTLDEAIRSLHDTAVRLRHDDPDAA